MLKRAVSAMEIPEDVSKRVPRVELLGRGSARIENFSHIVEYTDQRLLLRCAKEQLEITGEQFQIRFYSREELILDGKICQVRFV